MEDQMTVYVNPIRRIPHRRFVEEMMQNWNEDFANKLTFPVDVIADNDSFTIKALLPGINVEDLDIQIVNEIVTISGEIKDDREEGATYLLAERPSGRFHRVITLPTPLNPTKVEADLENGVLTLEIPKAEEAKPRTIKVNVK
jgi:HSP20 family protein